MLEVGDKAPEFTAPTDGGGMIRLRDLRGKKVILYFYPKDNTPGCTTEACDFRDASASLGEKGVSVVGVSPDTAASHDKFKGKFDLPFPLVSDPEHEISQSYGVWKEKSLYGRKFMGIERSTFVIDELGKIAEIYRKVRVKNHVGSLIEEL
jgi:peroxiredoxin Q/BCP